jgi:hypothetical protein
MAARLVCDVHESAVGGLMRIRVLLVLLATLVAFAGCNGGGSSSDDDDDDDDAATTATPAGTPSFALHIVPLLEESCGTLNNSCHTRVAYAAASSDDCRGWLALENTSLGAVFYAGPDAGDPTGCANATLYDRLTAPGLADAWECGPPAQAAAAKVPYVVPGDSAASYLFRKINGGPYCAPDAGGASDPMPQTGTLSAVDIDLIKRWIDGGAPQ